MVSRSRTPKEAIARDSVEFSSSDSGIEPRADSCLLAMRASPRVRRVRSARGGTCEVLSCHCPGTLWRHPQPPGMPALIRPTGIWAMIPWLPGPPGARTSVLTQATDPAVPARGWSGHRDQNIDVPGDDSGCFHV